MAIPTQAIIPIEQTGNSSVNPGSAHAPKKQTTGFTGRLQIQSRNAGVVARDPCSPETEAA